MSKSLKLAALLGLLSTTALAEGLTLGIGREATEAEIAAWDIDIRPDGMGLPPGSGSVADGEELYIMHCAACHGDFGEGLDRWPVLAGGEDTLASEDPVKTIGSYWPYLSTVWDYTHRAMPFGNAQSLTDDETYAITAYILYLNWLVEDDFVLSRDNFLDVEMPNADGFFDDPRPDIPQVADGPVCMTDCKEVVAITMTATVLDVTPDDGTSDAAPAEAEAAVEAPAGPDPELMARGEDVFRACSACHQIGDGARNVVGPILTGIVDAPIGAVDGFRYSPALSGLGEEGAVWDEAALTEFLTNPRQFAPGNRMAFAGVRDEADLTALIEYLRYGGQ